MVPTSPSLLERLQHQDPQAWQRLVSVYEPGYVQRLDTTQSHVMDAPPEALVHHPRYQVLRKLGEGGMGAVFLAEHRLMHRPVALKLIRTTALSHPQAIDRFRREVQAAARLSHPNIVTAHDAEEAGGVHFLAMEYVEGLTLSD